MKPTTDPLPLAQPPVPLPAIYLMLLGGVFSASTAVLWIKLSSVDATLLSAYRLLGAFVVLLPLFIRARRRLEKPPSIRRLLALGWVPGLLLALHFISWVEGARRTDAANASLIVNLVVVAMPFFLWFILRERLTAREWIGTTIALSGVVLLAWGDYHLAPENLIGDVICFASMLVYAAYMAVGRSRRDIPSLWLYVVPLYLIGGLFCLFFALVMGVRPGPLPVTEWALIAALVFIPTLLGHTGINLGLKYIRGQIVGLINLLQFVFAGVLAFFVLSEIPNLAFYPSAVIVLVGVLLVLGWDRWLWRKFKQPKRA